MEVDFDSLRRKIASCFNELCETELNDDQKEILKDMRVPLVFLVCLKGSNNGDCKFDALEDIELEWVPETEECWQ